MKRLLVIALALSVLASCKNDEPTPYIDFGFDYAPLSVGSWVEYDVDSIVFNEFDARTDSFHFIMRVECTEVYEDQTGRSVYRFEQTKRSNDTASSTFRKAFSLVKEGVRIERNEDNKISVPLTFPISIDASWDGNAFNVQDEQTFEIVAVESTAQINGVNLDSTATVLQINDTNNFVFKQFAQERYSRDIGLVYREQLIKETQFNIDSGLHWIQQIRASGP